MIDTFPPGAVVPDSVTAFPDEWFELATPNHFWMRWRFLAFQKMIFPLVGGASHPLKVLDVGAGNGALKSQIEGSTEWQVDAVDLDPEVTRRIPPGKGRTFNYDILSRAPEMVDRYDMVTAFDVIEHIDDSAGFVAALVSHVKPGGWIVINVPAMPSFFSAYDEIAGHVRRYSLESLQNEFSELPVDIRDTRFWGLSLVPILWARTLLFACRDRATLKVETGFAPPRPWMNTLLTAVGAFESKWIHHPPVGTSLFCCAQRRI